MVYQLVFTERYTRIAARFLKLHPEMANAYLKSKRPAEAS